MINHPNRSRIRAGMHIRHRLTGMEGNVIEVGLIGAEAGALVQWLHADGRRDGAPDWALLKNIEQYSEDAGPAAFRTYAAGRGEAMGRRKS